MAIPTITLPDFPLLTSFLGDLLQKVPFEIPTLMHPPLVHFAIALPVIIVILEVFNVFAKITSTKEEPRGKTVSALSLLMIVILFVVSIGAYATGVTDGTNGWDLLSSEAQTDLKVHKLMGAWIVLASAVLLVFKFLSMIGTKSRLFFLLLTIVFTMLSLQQGKQGGALVYTHGTNVAKVTDVMSDLDDAKEELEELEEAQTANTNGAKTLEQEKKALEEKVSTLNSQTETLKEEKEKLEKSIEEIKASNTLAIESAKKEAQLAIEKAQEGAKSMIDSIKDEANKTLELAKKVANNAKDKLINEESEAEVVPVEVEETPIAVEVTDKPKTEEVPEVKTEETNSSN